MLTALQGEVSMMLDLIDMLESQQHVGTASIIPQSSTLGQLAKQRDLRLQTRAAQLRVQTLCLAESSSRPVHTALASLKNDAQSFLHHFHFNVAVAISD